jgi:hypothetical protein
MALKGSEIGRWGTVPDEIDSARVFAIKTPEIKTMQSSQMVEPHFTSEPDVPSEDRT